MKALSLIDTEILEQELSNRRRLELAAQKLEKESKLSKLVKEMKLLGISQEYDDLSNKEFPFVFEDHVYQITIKFNLYIDIDGIEFDEVDFTTLIFNNNADISSKNPYIEKILEFEDYGVIFEQLTETKPLSIFYKQCQKEVSKKISSFVDKIKKLAKKHKVSCDDVWENI